MPRASPAQRPAGSPVLSGDSESERRRMPVSRCAEAPPRAPPKPEAARCESSPHYQVRRIPDSGLTGSIPVFLERRSRHRRGYGPGLRSTQGDCLLNLQTAQLLPPRKWFPELPQGTQWECRPAQEASMAGTSRMATKVLRLILWLHMPAIWDRSDRTAVARVTGWWHHLATAVTCRTARP